MKEVKYMKQTFLENEELERKLTDNMYIYLLIKKIDHLG
jgi:hypothetical protein